MSEAPGIRYHPRMTRGSRALAAAGCLTLAAACTAAPAPPAVPIAVPCVVAQPAPYPAGSPYTGVHANRENNDVVACDSGSAFVEVWHALEGLAMSQPNTFSPDGRVTYAATFNPDPAGCNVHAVSVDDGSVVWCETFPRSVGGSAIEVDEDGNLYLTAAAWVISLAPDGTERWRASVGMTSGGGDDFGDGPLGVHFTPDGHVATITNAGVVHLLSREDGRSLASLDLPAVLGFVPPAPLDTGGIDLSSLVPASVAADLEATFGPSTGAGAGLFAFLGAGGGFSDNTVGISSRREIFVVGGGRDPEHGALVQIRIEGTAEAPTLAAGWALHTTGGSATSPSITFDGRFVSVGDGSTLDALLDPRTAEAFLHVADVDACDANTDADPDAEDCAPAWSVPLERGPIAGSPPILPDGSLVFWEISVSQGLFPDTARDLVRVAPGGATVWERALPDALEWTSVITVTNEHLVGTASVIEPSGTRIVSVRLPRSVESSLAVVDRETGSLVFRAPVPDDATATVTIGPDGSLYVGMFGLLQILATETSPTLGLVRFAPTAE